MTTVHKIDQTGTHCSWCNADLAGRWDPGEYLHVSDTPGLESEVSHPFDARVEHPCGKVVTIAEDTGAFVAQIFVPADFTDGDAEAMADLDTMGRTYKLQHHAPLTVRLEAAQIPDWIKANLGN
jgi:hypothetical protein